MSFGTLKIPDDNFFTFLETMILEVALVFSLFVNGIMIQNFNKMNRAMFNENCRSIITENLTEHQLRQLFSSFHFSTNDSILAGSEYDSFRKWITIMTKPKSALIVVDVQNDFINGTLPISGGPAHQDAYEVVPVINNLLSKSTFDFIVYTQDWHPENSISFIDNVKLRPLDKSYSRTPDDTTDYVPRVFDTVRFLAPIPTTQKLWPKHCVQNSWGAKFHLDLNVITNRNKSMVLQKGTNPDIDSYSAFWDNNKIKQTELNRDLKKRNITDVYICGLAYDVCVAYTVMDALDLGYKTALLKQCSRGLDTKEMQRVDEQVRQKHGLVVADDDMVQQLLSGKRIPFDWALYVAENLDKF